MDRVVELITIVQREVAAYAVPAMRATLHYLENPAEQMYGVVAIPELRPDAKRRDPFFAVFARIAGGKVIIEADNTGSPLYDALIAAGIPADLIIEAYARPYPQPNPQAVPPTP